MYTGIQKQSWINADLEPGRIHKEGLGSHWRYPLQQRLAADPVICPASGHQRAAQRHSLLSSSIPVILVFRFPSNSSSGYHNRGAQRGFSRGFVRGGSRGCGGRDGKWGDPPPPPLPAALRLQSFSYLLLRTVTCHSDFTCCCEKNI